MERRRRWKALVPPRLEAHETSALTAPLLPCPTVANSDRSPLSDGDGGNSKGPATSKSPALAPAPQVYCYPKSWRLASPRQKSPDFRTLQSQPVRICAPKPF